ncbi:hypothetical protein ACFQPC_14835 [Herminiimonas glaciei]|uniref:Copper binding protein CusF n=1 Tax=Herminiimonas glaciei TaxID=523788 RepID=A0ABW2IEE2_9BURK
MMKRFLTLITMAITLSATGQVLAHGSKANHGGIVQSANDLSFELATRDGKVTIYVEDHDEEESTAGATGKLTILSGTEKTEVLLEPSGINKMVTRGEIKLSKGTKVIASITFANKNTVNVRFAIK